MAVAPSKPTRRTAPRTQVALPLTLARARGHGQPVSARTLDLSTGGARVAADRPLRVDEVLEFELACREDGASVCGACRVLREHVGRTYAVRFERLDGEAAVDRLSRLAAPPRGSAPASRPA